MIGGNFFSWMKSLKSSIDFQELTEARKTWQCLEKKNAIDRIGFLFRFSNSGMKLCQKSTACEKIGLYVGNVRVDTKEIWYGQQGKTGNETGFGLNAGRWEIADSDGELFGKAQSNETNEMLLVNVTRT